MIICLHSDLPIINKGDFSSHCLYCSCFCVGCFLVQLCKHTAMLISREDDVTNCTSTGALCCCNNIIRRVYSSQSDPFKETSESCHHSNTSESKEGSVIRTVRARAQHLLGQDNTAQQREQTARDKDNTAQQREQTARDKDNTAQQREQTARDKDCTTAVSWQSGFGKCVELVLSLKQREHSSLLHKAGLLSNL